MKTGTGIFSERIICMEWYVTVHSTFSLFFLINTAYIQYWKFTIIYTMNIALEQIQKKLRNLLRQVPQAYYHLHNIFSNC